MKELGSKGVVGGRAGKNYMIEKKTTKRIAKKRGFTV